MKLPRHKGLTLLSIIIFLIVWHIASRAVNSALILPSPFAVFRWIAHNAFEPVFLRHIGASCARAGISIALTIAAGSVLGVCSGLSPSFRRLISFPLTVVRAAPVVSIILLAVFWLGTNALPVFIAALMALPVMIDSVAAGIQKTPPRLRDAMKVYGFSRVMMLRHLYIPCAFPGFLSGSRSAFGLCWKVVAAGEVLALPRFGAGQLLYSAKVHLETTEVFAVTVILIAVCFALEGVFDALTKIKKQRALCETHCARKKEALTENTATRNHSLLTVSHRFLCVHNLCVSRGEKQLFRSFSVCFEQGKVTAIIAASGRGKTTLLDCIAGILLPKSGAITLECDEAGTLDIAHNESQQSARVSYLFQEPQLLPWRTIEQNISLPLKNLHSGETARAFLKKTGLASRAGSFPSELSGGERQRAALARAFCFPAPVLLMDEAFQSQDLPLKISLMELTKTLLQEETRTVILVTHDVREALCLADRILVLQGEPLEIARDIAVPRADAHKTIADSYVHITDKLLEIEEDILEVLSGDRER